MYECASMYDIMDVYKCVCLCVCGEGVHEREYICLINNTVACSWVC